MSEFCGFSCRIRQAWSLFYAASTALLQSVDRFEKLTNRLHCKHPVGQFPTQLTNLSNSRLWFGRSSGSLVIKPIVFKSGIQLIGVAVVTRARRHTHPISPQYCRHLAELVVFSSLLEERNSLSRKDSYIK